jgi:glutamine synthetase
VWGRDNRGAMVRVLGDGPSSTRLENRIGEPAANPYLYLASQLAAGLEGVAGGLEPGSGRRRALRGTRRTTPPLAGRGPRRAGVRPHARDRLGKDFVAYYTSIKRAEITRFSQEVTDWEQREYFRVF